MRIPNELVWNKNGNQKRPQSGSNAVLTRFIETYIIYKIQLPWRGKIMRTICTLLAVLLIFGPLGMGILFNVDAPEMGDKIPYSDGDEASFEDHGTRGEPTQGPAFVNLYLHRNGDVINTTAPWSSDPETETSDVTFTTDFSLNSKLWVTDTIGEKGMVAEVYVTGTSIPTASTLTVTVYDNDGGPQIGQGTYTFATTILSPQLISIDINFEASYNYNHNFSAGHNIVVNFDITGSVSILHDSENRQSRIRFNCKPITDIEVETYNFNNNPSDLFYPKNINFPVNRRQVKIVGTVTDAFGNYDVDYVSLEIEYPDSNTISRNASWNKQTGVYNYTWNYPSNSKAGKYSIVAHAVDKQGHDFTFQNNFTMSEYGVLLTCPDQEGGEGSYLAPAYRNIVQDETTTYKIIVYNIGTKGSTIKIDTALTTLDKTYWDWELKDENITLDSGKRSGQMGNLSAGSHIPIFLVVDGAGKDLQDYVGILAQGTCTEETSESDTLNTRTTVVVKFDVELEFKDGAPKTQTQNAEIGSEVNYDFKVMNEGGTDDYISFTISTPPAGWTSTLEGDMLETGPSQYGDLYVFLPSGEETDLTLTLGTPATGGDDEVIMTITGKSYGSKEQGDDVVESDMITTTTKLTTGVKLEVVGSPERTTDPEDQVIYELRLTNTGIASANLTVTFTQPDSDFGWSQGDISFSSSSYQNEKDFSNLAPDSAQNFNLFVEPSFEVQADNYTIDIKAYRNDAPQTRFDEKSVYCIITEITEIDAYPMDMSGEAEPGEDVEYSFTIDNNGNVKELVTIQVEEPGGWEVDFGDGSGDWLKEIDPQDSEIVTVRLSVPDDAAGDETVDITISVVPVERPDDLILIETHTKIKGSFTQTIFTLLVPILLLIVIIIMVIVIYRRR